MKKKKKILCILIFLVIIIILILVLINHKKNSSKNIFIGTWVSDGGTVYEFKKDLKGVMKVSSKEYSFSYSVSDDVLSIDFNDKKSNDPDYQYKCENDKCIFKSNKGKFIFTKQK